ncbi:MAG: TRAP transporter large permease [Spirochaetes bacterium]|nr:TRAP transporter large permease [Spirochaetota bacterium]
MSMEVLATIALLGSFVILLFIRIPVAFALLLSSVLSALVAGQGLSTLVQQMVKGIDSFTLLAIPFFIAMGEIMGEGGISEKIVDLANLLVGRFRGGLAYVNVIDSMFFGGISGSAVADVSSLGSIVIPMMVKQGYDDDFAVGLTVVTACQGVLIPPSHNMVIYALAAGIGGQIADLLWGGMIPGILLGCLLMIFCFFMAKKYNFPRCDPIPKGKRWKIVLNAILPMMIFVIIMGGMAAGVFTATEAAAAACVYTFILTYFILRSAKFKSLGKVLKNTLKTLAIVLTLIAAAKSFAYMMTVLRIPDAITAALIGLTTNRILLLLIINVLLLFLGCFMDMAPLILIMTPILMPVITGPVIHMSLVQFGIMLIYNLAVGLCTPPVGSALFVGCAIGRTPIERTAKKMLPMFGVMIVGLLMVTFIPDISLWLPHVIINR